MSTAGRKYELPHPVLKDGIEKNFPEDQLYAVEHNLDTLLPWIKYVENPENKNVFIFGTGSGGTTVACALNIGNGKVIGVDINENEIIKTGIRAEAYKVRDKIELQYLKTSYLLPFKDEAFDIAIVASVIEHITDERSKYIREIFRVIKKKGILFISGTPNLLYPKDKHTTNLYFIPWMSGKTAYKYAIKRKRWKEGENLDFAGRKGITYFQLKRWLKGLSYEIINESPGFTSKYLKTTDRINTIKRKIFFTPYKILEYTLAYIFKLPITAFMPYLNHIFIRKIS
jgi:ubiquinone/menaquinone biosynthesis C-methylase UbiE